MPIKVAFIGAGSVGFTRRLLKDILAVPELQDTDFSFHDISRRNLDMVAALCRKDIRENRLPAKITPALNRRKALEGAHYVINCTRIGGMEAYQLDVDIPLKYGVDQCVGDTLCVGGIMYGQRNIPCILDFCKDMREVSRPDALFLNYANPNAMNTWAAIEYGKVRAVGLCHGVQVGHGMIAWVIEQMWNRDRGKAPGDKGYRKISPREVDIICAGINHQTWYVQALFEGKDWTGRLLEGFQANKQFSRTEKVRIDVLKRFGYFSTESNGHLSEYVPWYRKRPKEIKKWIDLSSWINGETGGYLRVCTEGRNWFSTDFPRWLAEKSEPMDAAHRSAEHGSWIIEALQTGRVYRGHFNVRNQGTISNLPDDCVVEVPGYVDRNGIGIPRVGELPLACAATLMSSINVQRMSVRAAVAGDVTLLKQAALHDPLTGAICDPDEIWQMVDEMLVAQARWLPQYKREIPLAARRLAEARRKGDYRGTWKWKGAARLKVRTVSELRRQGRQARKETLEADKAEAKRQRARR